MRKRTVTFILFSILISLFLWGCGSSMDDPLNIARLYAQTYRNGGSVDEMEACLIAEGFPTVDSQGDYPGYLANPQALQDFWEKISAGEDADVTILSISETGSLMHMQFAVHSDEQVCTQTYLEWDEYQEPYISQQEQHILYDLELTEYGSFYYQIYPDDCHYENYGKIRLTPVNTEYYDLTQKYIAPIGYHQKNMFFLDWTEADFGGLCFNEVFECLQEMRTGIPPASTNLPYNPEEACTLISAAEFEETVESFFSVSTEVLRDKALYQEVEDAYPYAFTYAYYHDDIPDMAPMVTDVIENSDGTITLRVDVSSLDWKMDQVFCHEVTIRQTEDGGFQYVSNTITAQNVDKLPVSDPRLSIFANTEE